ncbi:hypothetical protein RFI_35675, partial [Reticulomyxa filosa]
MYGTEDKHNNNSRFHKRKNFKKKKGKGKHFWSFFFCGSHLTLNKAELKARNPPHFKITDINGQNIDNDQKLRIVFDTNPVRLFIHFIHKNNDEDMKHPNDEKQDVKNIELDQNKPWNEANKTAHTIVKQMIEKKQKGIVIVSTNLDEFAKSNDRWFFQGIDFSMMINSNKYMKEKKVISPYVVYSFHSKNITFNNITIDGCVYVIDCIIDGIGHFHITQHLIHTKKSVINYHFKQPIFTVSWPIDADEIFKSGIDSYEKSNFDEAISLIHFALCVRLQTLDDSDIKVANAFFWLGVVYNVKREYDKSIEYHEKALTIRLDKLGSGHIDVEEHDKAIEYYQKALKIRFEKLGSGHINVAILYNNLGIIYIKKREYDKSIEHHKKALTIRLDKLGSDHIDVGNSYNQLGIVHGEKGEYDKALEYYQKALKIRLEKLGNNHINVATLYNNLGRVYYLKDEYDKSYEYHKKALNIYSENIDGNQINIAICYCHLGNIHLEKGEYAESIEYYKKHLKISSEQLDEDHTNVATSFYCLGRSYFEIGEYETSIEYHEKALNIQLKKFGEKHALVAQSLNELGFVWIKGKQQMNKAKEYVDKALEILMNDKTSYDVLGLILEKNGTNEE